MALMPWMIPVLVVITLSGLFMFRRKVRKKRGLINSPGSKRQPTESSALLKTLQTILVDELQLPPKEFRFELATKHRDLALAFRQSFNLAMVRYTQKFWGEELTQELIPDVANRIACDYHGVIFSLPLTEAGYASAVNGFFTQKKRSWKSAIEAQQIDNQQDGWRFTLNDSKNLSVSTVLPIETNAFIEAWSAKMTDVLNQQTPETPVTAMVLRKTDVEIGVAFLPQSQLESVQRFQTVAKTLQPA